MTSIFSILFETILPVILIAGAGYILQRRMHPDPRSLSRLALYILSPCLGFTTIAQSKIATDTLWRMAAVAALGLIAMVLVGTLAAGLLRLSRPDRAALQLSLALPNAGNFGLSVCLLAFGEVGLSLALIYFITSSLLTNSLGVFLASRGGRSDGFKESLRSVLGMPLLYAAILGLIVNFTRFSVPAPLMKAVDLAGKAAVPVMLVNLGMQLAGSRLGQDWRVLSAGTVLKLLAAPALTLGLAAALRLSGVAWQVALVEAATPTAVTTVIVCDEFDASPALASSMVLVTTIFSLFTITGLLALIT